MYVVTFYSFKGGVGRSMALVNLAVDLARSGRRVLVVDFDLEAPGLDTYEIPRPQTPTPGVVEYVTEYIATGISPDAMDFMYEVPGIGSSEGQLWMMPAGVQDESYSFRLQAIDWFDIYEHHDGYLMLEDLRAQWRQGLAPDYVFIDSRTGHTDVGGICTRQLPDAVAVFFFPNDQNLRGLRRAVREIREEGASGRRRPIDLFFVMSNVPDLDDEDLILEDSIRTFGRDLGFSTPTQVIHRYDSLSLLRQVVFTRDRPRSRLAREYKDLLRKITRHNHEDRGSCLEFLQSITYGRAKSRVVEQVVDLDSRLGRIRQVHSGDGEVLMALASFYARDRRYEEAEPLFDAAIECGQRSPDAYLARAEFRQRTGDSGGAMEDAESLLSLLDASPMQILAALRFVPTDRLTSVIDRPAVAALSAKDRVTLASRLNHSDLDIALGRSLLGPLEGFESLLDSLIGREREDLVRTLVAVGRFQSAVQAVPAGLPSEGETFLFGFHYAMAVWGARRSPPVEVFRWVVDRGMEDSPGRADLTILQALAISKWAAGEGPAALRHLERIRGHRRFLEFSCWRYQVVSHWQFISDLESIAALVRGGGDVPAVLCNSSEHQLRIDVDA